MERRDDDGATLANELADRAERFLNSSSGWGQAHEHRGVLIEPRYDAVFSSAPARGPVGPSPRFRLLKRDVIEIKVTAVLGVPSSVFATVIGNDQKRWELERLEGRRGAPFVCANRTLAWAQFGAGRLEERRALPGCAIVEARLNHPDAIARVDAWAARLSRFFGADWLRVDILTGNEEQGWRVNEVTYPGHVPEVRAWERLLDAYQSPPPWVLLPAADVLNRIAADIGVPGAFLAEAPSYKLDE